MAVVHLPRDAMRQNTFPFDPNLPITRASLATSPLPTFIGFIDFGPEAWRKRFAQSMLMVSFHPSVRITFSHHRRFVVLERQRRKLPTATLAFTIGRE
jgi:hypothetical protein